jgi:DNA-directed RNA polymerase subunit RPC12/RpoP
MPNYHPSIFELSKATRRTPCPKCNQVMLIEVYPFIRYDGGMICDFSVGQFKCEDCKVSLWYCRMCDKAVIPDFGDDEMEYHGWNCPECGEYYE